MSSFVETIEHFISLFGAAEMSEFIPRVIFEAITVGKYMPLAAFCHSHPDIDIDHVTAASLKYANIQVEEVGPMWGPRLRYFFSGPVPVSEQLDYCERLEHFRANKPVPIRANVIIEAE